MTATEHKPTLPGSGTVVTVLAKRGRVHVEAKEARPRPTGKRVAEHAADALHGEETVRARGWALIVMLMTTSGLIFNVFLPGSAGVKWMFAMCVVALQGVALWAWFRSRSERTYNRTVFRVFGYTALFTALGITYYIGVFSPVPLVVTLGITFFGLGMDRVHAVVIPMAALVTYCTLVGLIIARVIPDLSLFPADDRPLISRLFVSVNVPLVYLVTLWFARLSRRTMADALDRSNRALLLAGQREAQLAEAHQDLERVLRAGAGAAGPFTGSAAGVYVLDEVIGHGAMGDIYAATRSDSPERVAVKVVRADVAHKPEIIERFIREGELASRLDNPHVVRIFGVGQVRTGLPFIAMEMLDGLDLAAILRQDTKLKLEDAIEMVRQIADGLSSAHAAGIVHRDLKPQNLFKIGGKGPPSWKILDFGISKLLGSSDTLTRDQLVGTPGYMSAEQARGGEVDARSDLYSLGAVTYRALAGIPPFPGQDVPRVLFDVCYVQPKQPTRVAPALSLDLERALAIALAKDPADRPATAETFAAMFVAAARGELPAELATRADALVALHPWGKRSKRAGSDPDD